MTTPRSLNRIRPRRGRLLVECLVSMLLLSVAAGALGTSTRALALLADDATLVARAHSLGTTLAERTHWQACAGSVIASAGLARVDVGATSVRDSTVVRTTVAATIAPSPLSRRASRSLSLSTGRVCR